MNFMAAKGTTFAVYFHTYMHSAHSFAKVLTNTQRFYKRTSIALNLHFWYFSCDLQNF